MSDRSSLVDRRGEPLQEPPRGCHRDKEHLLDTVSYFAIGFVIVGLVFSTIGFLYPRDVYRDPQASAEENEKIEQEFMELTDALNAIVIAGLILTGIGGLILSAIFTNTVVCHECHNDNNVHGSVTSQQMTSRRRTSSDQFSSPPSSSSAAVASPHVDSGSVNYGSVTADTG